MAKLDIYQAVTDRILELLDQGTVPWRQPLSGLGFPTNLASDKPYRGINVFLLSCTAMTQGYGSSYWLTYRQAREKGGHVRRGEKSSPVVFWKKLDPKPDPDRQPGETSSDDLKERFVLRYYNVFNADQCEGITPPDAEPPDPDAPPFEPIEEAQRIAEGFPNPPTIKHYGNQAFYSPTSDTVRIAEPERFESRESYYATLFHELAHATGHASRLDRGLEKKTAVFGTADYSREELVAEMGAAFLAAHAGIGPPTIEQSAAYIDGWRKKLSDDPKLVVHASGGAQRAADHILGVTFDNARQDNPRRQAPPPANDPGEPNADNAALDRLKADLQEFPRPGQANLNSTATREERSGYIAAVLGWWNSHVDQWERDGVIDPSQNPNVFDASNSADLFEPQPQAGV